MAECGSLEEVRKNIDRIDCEIVRLLSERGAYVEQAARFKKSVDDVKAPARVEEVILKVRGLAREYSVSEDMTERVYRTIVEHFINNEMKDYSKRDK